MALFSRACLVFTHMGRESCGPCQLLQENSILENILTRINEGVHENAGYAYYGFSALSEVLRRRTQQLRISELRGLNQAKKLLSKATVLSDQKRLLMAIASGKVNRVDRILSIGLRQKKGCPRAARIVCRSCRGPLPPKKLYRRGGYEGITAVETGGKSCCTNQSPRKRCAKCFIPANPLNCPPNCSFAQIPDNTGSPDKRRCVTPQCA